MIVDPETMKEIVQFLNEMAGQIPYSQRTVKGGADRQQRALELLDKLTEEIATR